MPKKTNRIELPRKKTTVELRIDLVERIPRGIAMTDALEPLLEEWLSISDENPIKTGSSPVVQNVTSDILTSVENYARQIIHAVHNERATLKRDGANRPRRAGENQAHDEKGKGRKPHTRSA